MSLKQGFYFSLDFFFLFLLYIGKLRMPSVGLESWEEGAV